MLAQRHGSTLNSRRTRAVATSVRWLSVGAAILVASLICARGRSRATARAPLGAAAKTRDGGFIRNPAPASIDRGTPGRTRPTRPEIVASLRFGGRIFLGREVSDINGIAAAIRDGKVKTVVLHVDESVPIEQLFFVLSAMRDLGIRDVRLGTGIDLIDVTLSSSFWKRLPGPFGHAPALLSTWISKDESEDDLHDLRERADAIRANGLRPLGLVSAQCIVPFHRLASALRSFAAASVEVELRYWAAGEDYWSVHDLPESPPDAEGWIGAAELRACRYRAVKLPDAYMAMTDKGNDPDDRVVLTVDASGDIWWRGRPLSLEGLAKALDRSAGKYRLKMKARGHEDNSTWHGVRYSELYVLVRVAADTDWRDVAWTLHVLAERRFYKVQFAVRASRFEPGVCTPCGLDGKLASFLPTMKKPALAMGTVPWPRGRVRINSGGSYEFDGHWSVNVADITKWLERREVHGILVEAGPGVKHRHVIAAIDAANKAGVEKVGYVGVPPPTAQQRRRCAPVPEGMMDAEIPRYGDER